MTRNALLFALLSASLSAPALAQTIVVDNADGLPEFVTSGNDWTDWGMLGHGFDGGDGDYLYLSHTLGGSDRRGTATWAPNLPVAGRYRIATWFRRTENRTPDADFFVVDGSGGDAHYAINQRGDGASGWVSLGTHWCAAGSGGCRVILDGTDDDHSDAANAVRFQLVEADPSPGSPPPPVSPPSPEPVPPCAGFPGLGVHQMDAWATRVRGPDFDDKGRATGAPDGRGAHSPNFDDGEFFRARGWTLCDPWGEESIDSLVLSVRLRTQYDSGRYEVRLRFDAQGGAASVVNGVGYRWHHLDITSDRGAWSWEDVAEVVAELTLHDHPGGRRDSDVWVDAVRLRVGYTTTAAPSSARDEDAGDSEPEECEGGCEFDSDWWWGEPQDGTNADGRELGDEAPSKSAEDDAPADFAADEDPERADEGGDGAGDDGGSGIAGDSGSGSGSALVLPEPATPSEACGGAGYALLLLVPLLGFRRR